MNRPDSITQQLTDLEIDNC